MMKKLYLISSFLICSLNASQEDIKSQLLKQKKKVDACEAKVNAIIKTSDPLQAEKRSVEAVNQLLQAQTAALQFLQGKMQPKINQEIEMSEKEIEMSEKAIEMSDKAIEMSKKSLEIYRETGLNIQPQTEAVQPLQAEKQSVKAVNQLLQGEMQPKINQEIEMSDKAIEMSKETRRLQAQTAAGQQFLQEMQPKINQEIEMSEKAIEMSKKSLEINKETRRLQAQTAAGQQFLQEMQTKMNQEAIEMSEKSLEINKETRRLQAQTAAAQQSLQAEMRTKTLEQEAETPVLRKPKYDLPSIMIIVLVTTICTLVAILKEKKEQLGKVKIEA